jgi:hypothetical protein
MLIVVIIVVCVVIAVIMGLMQSNVQHGHTQALATIDGFNPAVRFDGGFGPSLALDPASNRFAIMRGASVKVFTFDQLVAVEVERNGGLLTRTNRGSQAKGAIVGGVLLGPAGLLVGGLSGSKTTTDLVKRLSLKVFTKDLEQPVHEIVFFKDGQGKEQNSMFVRRAAERLDEWHGRFRTILAMQTAAVEPSAPAALSIPVDQIRSAETPASAPSKPRAGWISRTFSS